MKFPALVIVVVMLCSVAAFAGTIAGSVTDSDGNPLAGAIVYLADQDRNNRARIHTTTTRDGSFTFDRLEAGVYTLVARARGYNFTRVQVGVRLRGIAEVEITLNDNDRGRDDNRRRERRRRLRVRGD
ncbi:carboxypeptidase-like regulatory domain-containing protein [Calditrichota bacterium]